MIKSDFCLCENKGADHLRSTVIAKLISAFVFATQIIQFLLYRSRTIVVDFCHRFTDINMSDLPVTIGQVHPFHSYV